MKTLIVVIGALFFFSNSFAQKNIGIEVGSNLSFYSGGTTTDFYFEGQKLESEKILFPGVSVGLVNSIELPIDFYFHTKIEYIIQVFKLKTNHSAFISSVNTVEHFLALDFSIGYKVLKFHQFDTEILFGYVPTYFIGNYITSNTAPISSYQSHQHNGLDHLFKSGVSVGYQFDWGDFYLVSYFKMKLNNNVNSFDGKEIDFKYSSLSFSVGYTYNFN